MTSVIANEAKASSGSTGKKGKKPTSDRSRSENRLALKLVAAPLALMLLVTAFPMLRALYLSLFTYSLTAPDDRKFIGIDNYVTALTDGLFWRDTLVTVIIMIVTVAFELVIGFAFAMVMHRVIFARGVIRTSILIPYGVITVVSGFAWQFAFSNTNGFVNDWLPFIGTDFNWFADRNSSLIAIMASEIWKTTPFMSLLLLAGLAQVSEDMLEAAKVDGATWWQRLYKVILPNMRAAIMVAVLFRALDAYRIFDNIFVMTAGANDTESISFLTYRQVIEQFQLGIGSALSVLLFLSVLVVAFVIVKLFKVDLADARQEG
jgi:multiple sugar transport system permease protein